MSLTTSSRTRLCRNGILLLLLASVGCSGGDSGREGEPAAGGSTGCAVDDFDAQMTRFRGLIEERGPDSLDKAIAGLGELTTAAPQCAPAWAALAEAYALMIYYDAGQFDFGLREGEAAARQALELDPSQPTALVALANIFRDQREWVEASQAYEEVLAIEPENVEAQSQYSQFLARLGYFRRALPYAQTARRERPQGPIYVIVEGMLLYTLGVLESSPSQIQAGRDLLDEGVVKLQASGDFALISRFVALYGGDEAEADSTARSDLEDLLESNSVIGRLLGAETIPLLDDRAALSRHLQSELDRALNGDIPGFNQGGAVVAATVALRNGDRELAFRFLELLSRSGMVDPPWLWMPALSELRSGSEFVANSSLAAMVPLWDQLGPPDFCDITSDRYSCR